MDNLRFDEATFALFWDTFENGVNRATKATEYIGTVLCSMAMAQIEPPNSSFSN